MDGRAGRRPAGGGDELRPPRRWGEGERLGRPGAPGTHEAPLDDGPEDEYAALEEFERRPRRPRVKAAGLDEAARAGLALGRVVKIWSDWYDVESAGVRYACQPRGRLRHLSGGLRVGDRVRFSLRPGGEGVIEAVEPRRTVLDRPPVANVDLVAVVSAWSEPPWNAELVDRILVLAAAAGCEALLVLNKLDRLTAGDRAAAEEALRPYAEAGYPVVWTSALTGSGVEELRGRLTGRVAVFAGASGVGKTRLLAALAPGWELRSGEVSARLGRGRHTTRHVELIPVAADGWVADTPGFSRLDLDEVAPAELGGHFPEIAARAPACRFRGCLHRSEPGCAVRDAVDPGRYGRYLRLLAECEAAAEARYR